MKNYLILFILFTSCAGEGKYTTPNEDYINDDDGTMELINHLDSVMQTSSIEIDHIDETIVAVNKTVKREKKITKQLKETKKQLKETKKELKKVKKELVTLKKVAGKKNLIQKVFNVQVDSVEDNSSEFSQKSEY